MRIKEEWRFASVECGELCVMTEAGKKVADQMHEWFVSNWDWNLEVSYKHSSFLDYKEESQSRR